MHTPIYVMDEHVRAINARRHEQAFVREQIRSARGSQPAGINKVIANLRGVAGMWLITLGQRLQNRPDLGAHATAPALKPGGQQPA